MLATAILRAVVAHAALVAVALGDAAPESGRCAFWVEPAQGHFWDPSCRMGMEGCLADGRNVECRFCGGAFSTPCPATGTVPETTTVRQDTTSTAATTTPPTTTTAATTQPSTVTATVTTTAPPTTATATATPPSTAIATATATTTTGTTTQPSTASTTAQATLTTTQPPTSTGFLAPRATTTTTPSGASSTTVPSPGQGHGEWITGTWTTGYWDCCKPSCSWAGKGSVSKPVKTCDAKTGEVLWDPSVTSVCDGGSAAACTDQKPFLYNANLSMGFAAAAVSGGHGLTGDANCGQCFELRFVSRVHSDGNWGGADKELVGKRMIVQVTNIGYDVTGDHSFDLQIPGAGQGAFTSGCAAQFAGHSSGDFDCDNHFGGCTTRDGCARLPEELRGACEWRYDWFHWLEHEGKTNNPYVDFRRVRCPEQLTSLSGSAPTDDEDFPAADLGSGVRL